MKNESEKMKNELDRMVDKEGLPTILYALSGVCRDKAYRLRVNLQNELTAPAVVDLMKRSWRATHTSLAAKHKGEKESLRLKHICETHDAWDEHNRTLAPLTTTHLDIGLGFERLMDELTNQYVRTALWSSNDEDGKPLADNYGPEDIIPETLLVMATDCYRFRRENAADICGEDSQAGHDFWLTRNGHGAGFWDGYWPEPSATRLTDASKAFGEFNLFVGNNGEIDNL